MTFSGKAPLRIIPLGGVGEIGKNMLALECGDDVIVIDAGLMFPDEEMLGIDLVIPDITYLRQHKARVRGFVMTHAHEDHIGALPNVLRDLLAVPILGTQLTIVCIITQHIEQIVEIAADWGLHTAIVGSSMENNTKTARELGYLEYPEGSIVHPNEITKLKDQEIWIITTGSQGEPTSALSRMALGDHRHVAVKEGDTVVMSATPIPGNEELVSRTVDNLFKLGAEVIYDPQSRPHVSGHASQEELKLLLNILRPKNFLPIHGEYRMLVRHARLAMDLGVDPKNAFVLTNGDVLQIDEHGAHVGEKVPSGVVYVDGLGVGDVSQSVMRDRWSIGSDGIFLVVVTIEQRTGAVVAGPDIVTKGFVPEHDAAQLVEEAKQKILDGLAEAQTGEHLAEPAALKDAIHNSVANFLYERTKRRPMVLPVIMQV